MKPTLETLQVIEAIRREQREEAENVERDARVSGVARHFMGPATTALEAFDRAIDTVLALAREDAKDA